MAKLSAGILMYRGAGARASSFCSCIPAGRSGRRRIGAPGRSPRANMRRARSRSPSPSASSKKSSVPLRPSARYLQLGELKQPSRKVITAFAVEGDLDPGTLKSNHFAMEWPPKSGKMQSFPEVDRAAWFPDQAPRKSSPGKRRSSIVCSLREASITVRPEGRFYAKERLRSRSERMTLLMLS